MKNLIDRSFISKLYFNFNFNNFILKENQEYYQSQTKNIAQDPYRQNLSFYPQVPQELNLSSEVNAMDIFASILSQTNFKHEPYETNFQRFIDSIQIGKIKGKHSSINMEDPQQEATLEDLFRKFEEVSCFGLKVPYKVGGSLLRVDYVLSMGCFSIIRKAREAECDADLDEVVQSQTPVFSPYDQDSFKSPDCLKRIGKVNHIQKGQNTTVSNQKLAEQIYEFEEIQPPHLRFPIYD